MNKIRQSNLLSHTAIKTLQSLFATINSLTGRFGQMRCLCIDRLAGLSQIILKDKIAALLDLLYQSLPEIKVSKKCPELVLPVLVGDSALLLLRPGSLVPLPIYVHLSLVIVDLSLGDCLCFSPKICVTDRGY